MWADRHDQGPGLSARNPHDLRRPSLRRRSQTQRLRQLLGGERQGARKLQGRRVPGAHRARHEQQLADQEREQQRLGDGTQHSRRGVCQAQGNGKKIFPNSHSSPTPD